MWSGEKKRWGGGIGKHVLGDQIPVGRVGRLAGAAGKGIGPEELIAQVDGRGEGRGQRGEEGEERESGAHGGGYGCVKRLGVSE